MQFTRRGCGGHVQRILNNKIAIVKNVHNHRTDLEVFSSLGPISNALKIEVWATVRLISAKEGHSICREIENVLGYLHI